jgi:hypothetical protein
MRDVGDMSREAGSASRRGYALHEQLSKITALTNVSGLSECIVRKSKRLQNYLQHSRISIGSARATPLLLLDKAGRQCRTRLRQIFPSRRCRAQGHAEVMYLHRCYAMQDSS